MEPDRSTIWPFDEAGEPRDTALDGALDAMMSALLWWATALIPARKRERERAALAESA